MGLHSRRSVITSAVVVAFALALVAVRCSAGQPDAAPSTTEALATTRSSTSTTADPSVDGRDDEPDARYRVAVVSDSEVTPEIVQMLDEQRRFDVVSSVTEPGWRIGQLEDALAEAKAENPDVIVYSAGANDLQPLGPQGMLEALAPTLTNIRTDACPVYILPSVSTDGMEPAEAEQVTNVLAGFGDVLEGWQFAYVSYPDIAAALQDQGIDFYADGDLGSFHPGKGAYRSIAAEIARTIETQCPTP